MTSEKINEGENMKNFNKNQLMAAGLFALVIAATLHLTACGQISVGDGFGQPTAYTIESYNMDGTKLIVNGVKKQREPVTFNQDHYTISTTQRLLMRFENLNTKVNDIKNSWDDILNLSVVPTDPAAATALKTSAKLCTLTKNWMMLATWYLAHPFNKYGQWSTPGGDFDTASCITGEIQLPPNSTSPSPTTRVPATLASTDSLSATSLSPGLNVIDRPQVIFDIRPWFLSNPEGRNSNNGFILISDAPIDIFGDHSSQYSPRISWKKPRSRP